MSKDGSSRREFLGRGLGAGAAMLALGGTGSLFRSSAARAQTKKPPNFIIIYCDDLGYGDVGCFGSSAIRTPHIDHMAEEGVRFTDYYSCNAICAPSRAGLLTGRYPYRSGIYGNVYPDDEPFYNYAARTVGQAVFNELAAIDLREGDVVAGIPEKELLLPEALKTRSYRSGMVGKWHLGDYSIDPRFNPVRNGFDYYFGVPHSNDMNPCPLFENESMLEENLWGQDQSKLTGLYTKHALDFIRDAHAKDAPFFFYFAHTFPHQPLWASPDFAGKSAAGKFGDAVEEIDWSVGKLFETLTELGLDDNTLVIFTSDNGPWFEGSPGGLRGRKGQSMEGGFRVPMIARLPGRIPAGTMCHEPMMNFDFYPTFLDLAGVPLPTDRIVDGRDVFGLLTGAETKTPHDALFFYHFDRLEGVRVGKWKYLRRINRYVWPIPLDATDTANALAEYQLGNRWPLLYDLESDPGEAYNVIDRHPDLAKKMEALCAAEDQAREENPGGWK